MKASRAFTLIEMVVVIAIVGILAAVGFVTFKNQDEQTSVVLAQSVQANLQTTITQATARQDVQPLYLDSAAVVRAMSLQIERLDSSNARYMNFAQSTRAGSYTEFSLTLPNSRVVVYRVLTSGAVIVSRLTGFSNYRILDNEIKAN